MHASYIWLSLGRVGQTSRTNGSSSALLTYLVPLLRRHRRICTYDRCMERDTTYSTYITDRQTDMSHDHCQSIFYRLTRQFKLILHSIFNEQTEPFVSSPRNLKYYPNSSSPSVLGTASDTRHEPPHALRTYLSMLDLYLTLHSPCPTRPHLTKVCVW